MKGVVAFVTNNSFLDGVAFDGMRKHLERGFRRRFIIHRSQRERPEESGERRQVKRVDNIFDDQIPCGGRESVSSSKEQARNNLRRLKFRFYARVDDYLKAHDRAEISLISIQR